MSLEIESANATALLGPRFWPVSLLILMLILSGIGILRTYRSSKVKVEQTDEEIDDEAAEPERKFLSIPFSLITIASLILYALAVYALGYIVSTIAYIVFLAMAMGAKKKVIVLVVSVFVTFLFLWLFSIVLSVPLPRGLGLFRDLSYLLY